MDLSAVPANQIDFPSTDSQPAAGAETEPQLPHVTAPPARPVLTGRVKELYVASKDIGELALAVCGQYGVYHGSVDRLTKDVAQIELNRRLGVLNDWLTTPRPEMADVWLVTGDMPPRDNQAPLLGTRWPGVLLTLQVKVTALKAHVYKQGGLYRLLLTDPDSSDAQLAVQVLQGLTDDLNSYLSRVAAGEQQLDQPLPIDKFAPIEEALRRLSELHTLPWSPDYIERLMKRTRLATWLDRQGCDNPQERMARGAHLVACPAAAMFVQAVMDAGLANLIGQHAMLWPQAVPDDTAFPYYTMAQEHATLTALWPVLPAWIGFDPAGMMGRPPAIAGARLLMLFACLDDPARFLESDEFVHAVTPFMGVRWASVPGELRPCSEVLSLICTAARRIAGEALGLLRERTLVAIRDRNVKAMCAATLSERVAPEKSPVSDPPQETAAA